MMDRKLSAEEWLAELTAIVKKYRETAAAGPMAAKTAREEAITACRGLGLSEGEADRYLVPKPR